jgi:AraC family transcriptional activator of tynA and feaB
MHHVEQTPPALEQTGNGLVVLSTSAVRAHERLDYWRESVCREFVNVELSSPSGGDFQGALVSRSWADLRLSHICASAQRVQRTSRQAARASEDCYYAVLVLSGTELLEQDGKEVLLRAGDMALYDAARPHRLVFGDHFQKLILHVPRAIMRARVPGVERYAAMAISGKAGMGAIASNFLKACDGQASQLCQREIAGLSEQALGLLAMALGTLEPGTPSYSRSRSLSLCRVKDYVEQHLAVADLDGAVVSAAMGLSARYTNKLFEDDGTSLMRYIWRRRLERCRDELRDLAEDNRRLSEIALRWGFNDFSHFSRTFKARFGMSPRAFRNSALYL